MPTANAPQHPQPEPYSFRHFVLSSLPRHRRFVGSYRRHRVVVATASVHVFDVHGHSRAFPDDDSRASAEVDGSAATVFGRENATILATPSAASRYVHEQRRGKTFAVASISSCHLPRWGSRVSNVDDRTNGFRQWPPALDDTTMFSRAYRFRVGRPALPITFRFTAAAILLHIITPYLSQLPPPF